MGFESTHFLFQEHWPPYYDLAEDEDIEYQLTNLANTRIRAGKQWGINHPRARPSVYLTFERVQLDPAAMGPRSSNDNASGADLAPSYFINPSQVRVPPRKWLVDGYVARKFVAGLISPAGMGKTSFIAAFAAAVATGRADVLDLAIKQRSRVWSWNQEDDPDELARRVKAVLMHHKIDDAELLDERGRPMLAFNSGVEHPLMLARQNRNGLLVPSPDVEKVIAHIRAHDIGLFMMDPMVEFHEGEENDNPQMKTVWAQARKIAVKANCAVVVAAHSRKPSGASSDGHAGEQDSLRGASSQGGVVRMSFTLFDMPSKDAANCGVADDERHMFVRLNDAKANLKLKTNEAKWLRRVSVDIDEDQIPYEGPQYIGVLAPVSFAGRVRVEKQDLASLIARTLADNFDPGETVKIRTIVGKMEPSDRAAFGANGNTAATIKTLIRKSTGAKEGAAFARGKAEVRLSGGVLVFHKGKGTTGAIQAQWIPAS